MDSNTIPAIREATGAFCRSILYAILPAVREVARFNGYAVAVHGSLKRESELIAVAWPDQACEPGELINQVRGAVSGILGNCIQLTKPPTQKPHGRIAVTLVHPGFAGEIDLSIIPPKSKAEE